MATVTVNGTTYALVEDFTWREMSMLKRIGGVLPAQLSDALDGGDPDVIVALALVSIQRVNKAFSIDDLYDAPLEGGIVIEGDPEPTAPLDVVSPEAAATHDSVPE